MYLEQLEFLFLKKEEKIFLFSTSSEAISALTNPMWIGTRSRDRQLLANRIDR